MRAASFRCLPLRWVFLIVLIGVRDAMPQDDRDALWTKVRTATEQGLPQTAIEHLRSIQQGAFEGGAHAEGIRALCQRLVLQTGVEGGDSAYALRQLTEELPGTPEAARPMLKAILANWYWGYYNQNRWRFMERTRTSAPTGDDFTTWDLPRLLAEVERHFEEALADSNALRNIPVATFDRLLDKGSVPDSYRPTLYDFIAFEAFTFYGLAEHGSRPQGAYDLPASSPILGTWEEFVAWQPPQNLDRSPELKAIALLHALAEFHADDANLDARLDLDLTRLAFGHDHARGEEKDPRYAAALRRFMDDHRDHESFSRAAGLLAGLFQSQGKLVEARKVALEGFAVHKDSAGWKLCGNLISQIEARSAEVTTERVWNDPWPSIHVTYRNVTQVHFRLIALQVDQELAQGKYQPNQIDWERREGLVNRPIVRAWSANLPPTTDYQQRLEQVPLPDDLPSGPHYLLASFDPAFVAENNQVSVAEVWISPLALVLRTQYGDGQIEGMVTDARSGTPIANAEVVVWAPKAQRIDPTFVPGKPFRTNSDGVFRAPATPNTTHLVDVRHQGQRLMCGQQIWQQTYYAQPGTIQRTYFFTDRALYRPGQTISYKGICLNADQREDHYAVLPATAVTVTLRDANGQDLESQNHRTNSQGSFSGSFTAPRDRGTGAMSLVITAGPGGAQGIQIEEYKRPKFLVSLTAPRNPPRLQGEVVVQGSARSYAEAPIDGATVRWRVTRGTRYPDWWFRRCFWWPRDADTQEIASGSTTTDAAGEFAVHFTAIPDTKVPRESEPIFTYSVTADVIDSTGETRSAAVDTRVGYTALAATVSADAWQTVANPVKVKILTSTLDGTGQAAEGTLRIFRLKSPQKVRRAELAGQSTWRLDYLRRIAPQAGALPTDDTDIHTWPDGPQESEQPFKTSADGTTEIPLKLAAGVYRARIRTQDPFGAEIVGEQVIRVLDLQATSFAIKIPDCFDAPSWTVEPGQEFLALWGTGYEEGRAYLEVEHRGSIIRSEWTDPKKTQHLLRVPVTEAMRGGFTVRATYIRENRAYLHIQRVDVPWSNKRLTVRWDHFVSKLQPNQEETWTAVVSGPDATRAAAEMVATLYDASLDAYLPHQWPSGWDIFRVDHASRQLSFENQQQSLQSILYGWSGSPYSGTWEYRHLPYEFAFGSNLYRGDLSLGLGLQDALGFQRFGGGGVGGDRLGMAAPMSMAAESVMDGAARAEGPRGRMNRAMDKSEAKAPGGEPPSDISMSPATVNLDQVSARKNLQETAFFFPHLLSDKDGKVSLRFTMPEALTEWRFLGLAHDTEARAGLLTDKVVTSKDLMVIPNPPRFLREGDVLEFSAKVVNKSATRQGGKVRLTFTNAQNEQPFDDALDNSKNVQAFDLAAGESKGFRWTLRVPDAAPTLVYKVVAATERISDGEEGFLPVLSRRVLVTEALPLPIRGNQTREFTFERLRDSAKSETLVHAGLNIQVTSNPAWYAVMALPYLMEFPYECNEQTFNRLYANSLAAHIAQSQPRIAGIFAQWRGTSALESPLLKNQDLKAIMIEETPWLLEAQQETAARRNVGLLFDPNRLRDEQTRALRRLMDNQHEDGSWSWFPGGRPNEYITLYIVTGFGRLRHLGVEIELDLPFKAIASLDRWMDKRYRENVARGNQAANHLDATVCLYLYARGFFLEDVAIAAEHREAIDYFLDQARRHWVTLGDRQSQGHLALALKRFGDPKTPMAIVASLKERALSDDEMGMYWREGESPWWWYQAPIETQALMIEVMDEVAGDAQAVEECKIWLLKQKQTRDWKTTKATADAIYGLLLRGSEMLAASDLVQVRLGDREIHPEKAEAGTGYYQQRIPAAEIAPALAAIQVKNPNPGIAWGSAHWQYFEDMRNVTSHTGTPLKLTKSLFVKQNTPQGPTLVPAQADVHVGDELVTRMELRVDRDMEFVHLKDYRGSGTEPVDVLSQYRYQDGLAYFQSTRDTASHFFIDYLPRGTYVFEYSVRVQHLGEYQTGFAQIECMYAPEFNSHSESIGLKVKE